MCYTLAESFEAYQAIFRPGKVFTATSAGLAKVVFGVSLTTILARSIGLERVARLTLAPLLLIAKVLRLVKSAVVTVMTLVKRSKAPNAIY